MFQIGEFSKITQVSVRMLRYYDSNNLLHPAYTDEQSGYRMYTAGQIDRLNKIVRYRDLGFGVKEIAQLLQINCSDELNEMLRKKLEETKLEIAAKQTMLDNLESMLHDTNFTDINLNIQIVLKNIAPYHVLFMRKRVENYYCEGEMWSEFTPYCAGLEANSAFTIYHDTDYREEDVDIELCLRIDEESFAELSKKYPASTADGTVIGVRTTREFALVASFMVYGPYSNISKAYKEFAYWLENHPEYALEGESRQICHVSYDKTTNEDEFVTEILVPLVWKE